jgi:hypothetical protein
MAVNPFAEGEKWHDMGILNAFPRQCGYRSASLIETDQVFKLTTLGVDDGAMCVYEFESFDALAEAANKRYEEWLGFGFVTETSLADMPQDDADDIALDELHGFMIHHDVLWG